MNKSKLPIFLLALSITAVATFAQSGLQPIFDHPLKLAHSIPDLHFLFQPGKVDVCTLNVLAVMVEFKEDAEPRTYGNGRFDTSQTNLRVIGAPPHNRLYFQNHLIFVENYFRKVSNGKCIVKGEVHDSIFRLPNEMKYYSPPRNSVNNIELGRLIQDTWLLVDSMNKVWRQSDSTIPRILFNKYNTFIIFHAGVGRDVNLVSLYGYDPWPFDIPSLYINHASLKKMFGESYQGVPVLDSSFYIKHSIVLPETESRELPSTTGTVRLNLGMNGLVAASIGSHLGLPDLFNTRTGHSGIGRFGLMDGQSMFSWMGCFPPEPSAWEKVFLGWVNPIVISRGDSIYELPAVGDTGIEDTIYKVLISSQEYFLIENRNRDANRDGARVQMFWDGQIIEKTYFRDTTDFNAFDPDSIYGVVIDVDEFDWSLPGGVDRRTNEWFDGGILIWHIDETVINANLHTNTINANPDRRGVDLEEADGSQDIGQVYGMLSPGSGSEDGTALDFWYRGNTSPVRKRLNAFTPTSYPNSLSNDFANSHVYIGNRSPGDTTGISYRGPRMKVRIQIGDDVIQPLAGFPKNLQGEFLNNSVCVSDINADGNQDIIIASRNGKLAGWQTDGSAIGPFFSCSGILSKAVPGKDIKFFGKPVVTDFFDDNILDIGILRERGFSPPTIPPISGFDFYAIRDLDADSLADLVFEDNINFQELPTTPFIVATDSFLVVPELKTFLILSRIDATIKGVITFPDSSFVSGAAIWQKPSTIVVTSTTGYIGIVSISGYSNFKKITNSVLSGPVVSIISSSIGRRITVSTRDGYVFLFDGSLNISQGFPIRLGSEIYESPVFADIDGDGQKDIVAFCNNKIYVVNSAGAMVDNFPVIVPTKKVEPYTIRTIDSTIFIFSGNTILSSPIVADLDGNQSQDILAVTQEGLVVAYDKYGKLLNGFPLLVGQNSGSTPAVFYISTGIPNSVDIGIVVVSDDGFVYAWKTGTYSSFQGQIHKQQWPQYKYDAQNSGLVEDFVEPSIRSEFLPPARVYNYPNPVTKEHDFKTYIRYYLNENAKVHIRIFDLAGDKVAEFEGPGIGGFDNEIMWDVRDIESGVYFGHIEATSQSRNESVIIKIAVVK